MTGHRNGKQFCEDYSRKKFGDGVMTGERLDRLFQSDIVSHVLVYTDSQTKQNIGPCGTLPGAAPVGLLLLCLL